MTLQDFADSLVADNPRVISRKMDACDWYFEHPTKGKLNVCHNRTIWGAHRTKELHPTPAQVFHGIYKEIRDIYWTNVIYTDKELGNKEAKQYGGELEECFYCDEDNLTYFIAFNDFDKMAGFMYDKLGLKPE